ncbi:Tyrosine- phosphatase non-receptor type 23 [Brachionus plicatilis]|uniref:Tyrosine-phosphatase non-receptor type 23 n=1 Tax=Brachionus plicatilis TaxID=10195 RepID=A0A3M7R9X4_BRAPC|nr:Tyrosine- phosphatase non-receptor type 23 [Brachionus plicatilis]
MITEKKTSIDDLLDIFNSSNSNLPVQPALEPIRIDARQIAGKTVEAHSDPVPVKDQCIEPDCQANKLDKEFSNMIDSTLVEPNVSSQPNCGLNILNKENRMEKFISEVNKFEHHVNCLNDKTLSYGTVLDKEWKELNDHQDKTSSQMTISIARLNPHQNRYQDLLPFDQTRVCLQAKQNDYINASYLAQINQDLDPLHKQANFLVTQLPMKDFGDFWNMVVQEQCEILVNLCRDNELNQSLYFPLDKQNTLLVAGVNVQLQSFKETNCSIQRVFTLQKDSQTRTVVMLQFKWDNSKSPSITSVTGIAQNEMPDNVGTFLKFVKECENFYLKEQRNRNKPILVHCMNGVSRSAVFILLYSMIQIVDTICQSDCFTAQFNSDLVLKSVKQMRAKRKYMIQSTYHLKYSYDAILYYMKDLLIKQGVFVSNETNFERRNSNIETSILNDQSVVSIQSTRVEKNGGCLSLNDIVDPGKFNLDLDDVKRKTSKKDFLNGTEKSVTENDPFEWLDPLK